MLAKQCLSLFCAFIVVFSILSSASATAETSLDKIRQYQKHIEDAVRKAAEQEAQQSQEQQLPLQNQQGQPIQDNDKQNNQKQFLPDYEPSRSDAPAKPALMPEEDSEPIERPPPVSPSAPPERPPRTSSRDATTSCSPSLPRWACDGSSDHEDPDTIVQKILEWREERESEAALVEEINITLPSPRAAIFQYDNNGNLIDDGIYHYYYNSFNELDLVLDKRTIRVIEQYWYGHDGNRAKKKVFNGSITETTYYQGAYSFTIVRDGYWINTKQQTRFYDDGQLIALKENDNMSFYHPDQLGSTSLVTDEEGEVIERVEYAPFGVPITANDQNYLYTGKELDSTGLMYYGARYYNPLHARFTQPDMVIADIYNPQNLNRYSYVLNNPYKYTDPNGNVIDTLADVGFIGWDIYDIWHDPTSGTNWAALGGDIVGAFVPLLTGVGRGIKQAAKVTVKTGDKVGDAQRGMRATVGITRLSKNAKILQSGPSRTTVEVGSFGEAEKLLHEAFPDYVKVRGNTQTLRSTEEHLKFRELFNKGGTYKMDYQYITNSPDKGKIHSQGMHADLPHINIKRRDGNEVTIIINKVNG